MYLDGDQHLLDGASAGIFLAPLWPFSCIFSSILFAACLISEPSFADAPSCWILVVPFGWFLLIIGIWSNLIYEPYYFWPVFPLLNQLHIVNFLAS